ncbi:MAG: hypothetical protein EOP48_35075, partial [Sphingobacteriales bacterium]
MFWIRFLDRLSPRPYSITCLSNKKFSFKKNNHLVNVLSLVLSVLFSCNKAGLQEPVSAELEGSEATISTLATTSLGKNLLYNETFEGSSYFNGLNTQFETSHAFTLTSSPLFQGTKSGRFELRDTDPENNGGVRAEVVFPVASNLNRWYSFAAYFPSADFKPDSGDELIGQWKQHEHDVSSAISLRIKDDKFRLAVFPGYKITSEKIDLGSVPKDKWVTFVIHIKHSTGSDGLIEFWINGQKVVNRAGSN